MWCVTFLDLSGGWLVFLDVIFVDHLLLLRVEEQDQSFAAASSVTSSQ